MTRAARTKQARGPFEHERVDEDEVGLLSPAFARLPRGACWRRHRELRGHVEVDVDADVDADL